MQKLTTRFNIKIDGGIEVSAYDGWIVNGMDENFDYLEVGLIQIVSDRNSEIIIAKEMRVGNVCPVAIHGINGGNTMNRGSGNCKVGTISKTVEVGGVQVSERNTILLGSLIEVTIDVSRVVYGMNENIDDFEGGLIEVIGEEIVKLSSPKVRVGDVCPVTIHGSMAEIPSLRGVEIAK